MWLPVIRLSTTFSFSFRAAADFEEKRILRAFGRTCAKRGLRSHVTKAARIADGVFVRFAPNPAKFD